MKFSIFIDGRALVGIWENPVVPVGNDGTFAYTFTEKYGGKPNVQGALETSVLMNTAASLQWNFTFVTDGNGNYTGLKGWVAQTGTTSIAAVTSLVQLQASVGYTTFIHLSISNQPS